MRRDTYDDFLSGYAAGDDAASDDRSPPHAPAHAEKPITAAHHAHHAGAVPARPSTLRSILIVDRRAAAFTAVGFLAGCMTWHMIGFWTFVGDVLLPVEPQLASRRPVSEAAAVAATPTRMTGAPLATGALPTYALTDHACTTLAKTEPARALPCPRVSEPFRDAGRRHRTHRARSAAERLAAPETWASTTETHAP